MDPDAFLAGYMYKEGGAGAAAAAATAAAAKGAGKLASGASGIVGTAAPWAWKEVKQLIAILSLVPPAVGAVAGLVASKMTSPSASDEATFNALIEEQETDRMLAETSRLTQAQRGKLKRNKEKKDERSLYLG